MTAPAVPRSAFPRLLTASGLSNLGDGVHIVAFPLLATTLTTDPRPVAALATVATLPALLFSLPVGGLVDRLPRGRLMVGVDAVRALLLAVLVALVLTGRVELWHLFVIAAALGTAEIVFDSAASAFLPSLVPTRELARANGRLATVAEIGNGVFGPALGGLVFAVASGLPFAYNGVSFLASALLLVGFAWRRPGPVAAGSDAADGRRRFWADVLDGVRWLLAHRPLRALAGVVAAWNVLGWMPEGTFVLYAKQELGLSDAGFGLLFAAPSVGAVLGGLAAGAMVERLGVTRVLMLTITAYALLTIPPAFLSSSIAVGAVLFVQGFPLIAWGVVSTTARQTLVPDELRGRVGSVFFLLSAGLAPVGLFLGGLVASGFGLRAVFVVSGVGLLVAALPFAGGLRELGDAARRRTDQSPE